MIILAHIPINYCRICKSALVFHLFSNYHFFFMYSLSVKEKGLAFAVVGCFLEVVAGDCMKRTERDPLRISNNKQGSDNTEN